MTDHPLLEQAARSLRERTATEREVGEDEGEQTLARVVSVVRGRARRRRLILVLGLQAAIGATGVGAWAAASGRLEALFAAIRPAPAPLPPAPMPRPSAPRRSAAPVAPAPTIAPAPPTVAPAPLAAVPPVRRVAAVSPTRTPPARPDEDARYREAHQAHFVQRDFLAALVAWDRYLSLERPGRFVLEARYNRAIALFRLGRLDEAALALRPFADGDYGSYRRDEARALLQRLGRPPPRH